MMKLSQYNTNEDHSMMEKHTSPVNAAKKNIIKIYHSLPNAQHLLSLYNIYNAKIHYVQNNSRLI